MGAQEDVNKTVGAVEKTIKEEGTQKAYENLQRDFQTQSQTHKDDPAALQEYWNGVNTALKEKGLLGTLSLEYAKSNTLVQNENGTVTERSVERERSRNERDLGRNQDRLGQYSNERFDLMFQNELRDQFKGRKDWAADGVLSRHEVSSRLTNYDNQRKEQNGKEALRADVSDLITVREGQDTSDFFNVLDTARDGGQGDGHISSDDINSYVDGANAALAEAQRGNPAAQLPADFDPARPGETRYNQKWLESAKKLQNDDLFEKYDNNDGIFGGEYITKDSLASALGYADAGDMSRQNQKKADAPVEVADPNKPWTPEQKKEFADSTIATMAGFPAPAEGQPGYFKYNQETKDYQVTRADLAKAAEDPNLTNNQKAFLANLDKNWDQYGKGKESIGITADVLKGGGYTGETASAEMAKYTKASQDLMAGLKQVPQEGLVKDGAIQRQSVIDAYNAQTDKESPQAKALANLRDNFDNIATGEAIKVPSDFQRYAANTSMEGNPVKYEGFQGDAPPAPSESDQLVKTKVDEQLAKAGVGTELQLGKDGTVLYDIARKSLEMRKAAGEDVPMGHKDIMRESVRIAIANGLLDESYAGKDSIPASSGINGKIKSNMTFKLYSEKEIAEKRAKAEEAVKMSLYTEDPDKYSDYGNVRS